MNIEELEAERAFKQFTKHRKDGREIEACVLLMQDPMTKICKFLGIQLKKTGVAPHHKKAVPNIASRGGGEVVTQHLKEPVVSRQKEDFIAQPWYPRREEEYRPNGTSFIDYVFWRMNGIKMEFNPILANYCSHYIYNKAITLAPNGAKKAPIKASWPKGSDLSVILKLHDEIDSNLNEIKEDFINKGPRFAGSSKFSSGVKARFTMPQSNSTNRKQKARAKKDKIEEIFRAKSTRANIVENRSVRNSVGRQIEAQLLQKAAEVENSKGPVMNSARAESIRGKSVGKGTIKIPTTATIEVRKEAPKLEMTGGRLAVYDSRSEGEGTAKIAKDDQVREEDGEIVGKLAEVQNFRKRPQWRPSTAPYKYLHVSSDLVGSLQGLKAMMGEVEAKALAKQ